MSVCVCVSVNKRSRKATTTRTYHTRTHAHRKHSFTPLRTGGNFASGLVLCEHVSIFGTRGIHCSCLLAERKEGRKEGRKERNKRLNTDNTRDKSMRQSQRKQKERQWKEKQNKAEGKSSFFGVANPLPPSCSIPLNPEDLLFHPASSSSSMVHSMVEMHAHTEKAQCCLPLLLPLLLLLNMEGLALALPPWLLLMLFSFFMGGPPGWRCGLLCFRFRFEMLAPMLNVNTLPLLPAVACVSVCG